LIVPDPCQKLKRSSNSCRRPSCSAGWESRSCRYRRCCRSRDPAWRHGRQGRRRCGAFFNAPIDRDRHAARAVDCAIAIRDWTAAYRLGPAATRLGFARIRIGVESEAVNDIGLRMKLFRREQRRRPGGATVAHEAPGSAQPTGDQYDHAHPWADCRRRDRGPSSAHCERGRARRRRNFRDESQRFHFNLNHCPATAGAAAAAAGQSGVPAAMEHVLTSVRPRGATATRRQSPEGNRGFRRGRSSSIIARRPRAWGISR